ncbi:hypothetical protein AI2710V1_1197, partial [Enterobacter cloacae]
VARPKSEDKKQALLDAATTAFAQSGVAASTALIARKAGVAEGTLFTLVFMYLELNSTFLFLEFKLFIVIERYPFNVQQAC